MKLQIVTPQHESAITGNLVTAARYRALLRRLGHRVTVTAAYDGTPCDALIALHARRSFPSVQQFAAVHPERPLIVVLTGTDLYRDIQSDADAQRALDLATRLVVLQRQGLAELPAALRDKTRVIYQGAPCLRAAVQRPAREFRVCVVGHLRPEKDPLRTALAARELPAASRLRVLHVGAALSPEWAEAARAEMACNPRYRWLGEQPHARARRLIASSHLLALTSLMEGSSNALGEALAQPTPTPVVAARIGGLVGTLGDDYPGYFPVGDTAALTALLWRAETDAAFYAALAAGCARAAPLVAPERERAAWAALLAELPTPAPRRRAPARVAVGAAR
ncbi:MAG TPA: selenoneine biosynthesis selenosugar synthase SenB [Chloroflexota bacterium]|nr:selenoneine biosynthesis selenosugar synthase SenB [Chloroflexota bacterium]